MMAGALGRYAFLNAKLRTRLSAILTDDFFDALLRAPSLPEAVQMLRETPFAFLEETYRETGDLKMMERELHRSEIRMHRELERHVSAEPAALLRSLTLWYEIHTLKSALRLWYGRRYGGWRGGTASSYILRETIIHPLPIDEILEAESLADIADSLSGTPYEMILREAAAEVESRKSLFPAEIALDRAFYERLWASVGQLRGRDRPVAARLIGVETDIHNVQWLARFKGSYDLPRDRAIGYLIPHGFNLDRRTAAELYSSGNAAEMISSFVKSRYPVPASMLTGESGESLGRLSLVEAVLARIRSTEVERALMGYPFTVGVMLGYFFSKKEEIRKIITVLNARSYGLSEDRVRQVL